MKIREIRWPTLRTIALLLAVTSLVGAPVTTAAPTGPIVVGQFGLTWIPWLDLGVPLSINTLQIEKLPTHGTLVVDNSARTLTFEPDLEFWGLGQDRFEVSWLSGSSQLTTVLLVAVDDLMELVTGFEPGDPLPSVDGAPLVIGSAGVLTGANGLSYQLEGTSQTSAGSFDQLALGLPFGNPAGNGSSGETLITVDPPPNGDPFTPPPVPGFWGFLGATSGSSTTGPVAEVRAAWANGGTILQALWQQGGGTGQLESDLASAPHLSPGAHRVRLQAWTFTENLMRVLVDDRAVLELEPPSAVSLVDGGLAFGHLSGAPDFDHFVRIDHTKAALGIEGPVWQLLLADDFDNGLGQWTYVGQGAGTVIAPSVSEQLEIDVVGSSGWGAWLGDSTANAAQQFTGRFTLDPSQLTMAPGEELLLLIGYDTDTPSGNHLQLRLRPSGNDFQLRADARADNGSLSATSWQTLDRSEHLIEWRWRAATVNATADGADGYVRLYVNGEYADEVTGIANGSRRIDYLRFGAMALDDGTFGQLVIDDYVSWTPTELVGFE